MFETIRTQRIHKTMASLYLPGMPLLCFSSLTRLDPQARQPEMAIDGQAFRLCR
jgi:hypothetical protein